LRRATAKILYVEPSHTPILTEWYAETARRSQARLTRTCSTPQDPCERGT
jgi:hypothetical protein